MRRIQQVLVSISAGLPLLVWGLVYTGTPVAAAAPQAQAAPNADMPEAPGKAITIATCTKCHSISNATAQHKDADGWTTTITKMVGYGAVGSDDDFQAILTYLAKYYGTDTPAADVVAAAHGKILVNKATAAQLATDLGLTGDEATAVVSYRTKNGDFKGIDELKKVPNVDAKKIDAKKDDLQF